MSSSRGPVTGRQHPSPIINHFSANLTLPSDRDIRQNLLPTPLRTLVKPAAGAARAAPSSLELKDPTYVGSYNWIEAVNPTIIVPGAPPEWQDRSPPFQVQPDTGTKFVDQNGYRSPSSTLLPLFRAVDALAEENSDAADLEWGGLDFVTDRNNLRKLMRWLNDTDGTCKDFRIDLQLAGTKTVLLNRWEKRHRETMPGVTFGFGFEAANTKLVKGCEKSTGHHRIIKYDMDGLSLVVRFEVDACTPQPQTKPTIPAAIPPLPQSSSNVDDLSDLLSGLKVSPTAATTTTTATSSDITIIHAGYQVPQSAIMELTTRSERNAVNLDWSENYPQLFLSQTPQHVLGIHARGRFRRVERRRLDSPEMRRVEADCQRTLKQLRAMLKVIQDLAREHGQRGRLSLVCQHGILKVYERENKQSCLPDEITNRF